MLLQVYKVVDADGSYRFFAEEKRSTFADVEDDIEDFLDEIDEFGIPQRTMKAKALFGIPRDGNTKIAKIGPVYAIDVEGPLPESLDELLKTSACRHYPRPMSRDGVLRQNVADAKEAVTFMPDGCATMPAIVGRDGLRWMLFCEQSSTDTQHVEFLSEDGFSFNMGECDLYHVPDLSEMDRLAYVSRELSRKGGEAGVPADGDSLSEFGEGEMTIEMAMYPKRAEWGLIPNIEPGGIEPTPRSRMKLMSHITKGFLDKALTDVVLNTTLCHALLSEDDCQMLIAAGDMYQRSSHAFKEGEYCRAYEAADFRLMHHDRIEATPWWMSAHGIQVERTDVSGKICQRDGAFSFGGDNFTLHVESYITNPTAMAIRAVNAKDNTMAALTVNLGEPMNFAEAYVDESELPGVANALRDAGIAQFTGVSAHDMESGFSYPLMRFDVLALVRSDPEGYASYVEGWAPPEQQRNFVVYDDTASTMQCDGVTYDFE